ncbi:MAG: hypothetical protein RL318_383, partial [Fibrobacterota bacterium]
MSTSLFHRITTNRIGLIMVSLLMAMLAACDSTTSSDSPTQVDPKVVAQEDPTVVAERATLDTLLSTLPYTMDAPIQEIASRLDLRRNFDFSLPSGIDTTLLSDCLSGAVRCSSSTLDGKTIIQNGDYYSYYGAHRQAIYPASPTLDLLLDSTTRTAHMEDLPSVEATLISSRYSWSEYHPKQSLSRVERTTFSRTLKDGAMFSTYQSETGTIFDKVARSVTIRSIDGIALGLSQGSRPAIVNGPSYGLEWTAVGSAIQPKADTMGTAEVRWSSSGGDSIHGMVRFEGGKSKLLNLQARKLSGYDSIWLRAPDCLVLVKAKDTIFVWWHGTDMKAPTFDSLAFHF